ncbi:MAG TPA: WbqC family protein [Anaerolineae bacterium]|nr:WbqC family protein [Anaerolineae bacterium]
MKIGIMQPYFFPYLGYFDLINVVDHFVVYDSVQYIKQGWINRNRILKPAAGWQYITVPVDRSSFHDSYRTAIMDVEICELENWKGRIIRQLDHYRGKAPYFWETVNLVKSCLDVEERSIARLNVSTLEKMCHALHLGFNYRFSSEIHLTLDRSLSALDRLLAICENLGATKYINTPGGRDLYGDQPFREKGMEVEFRNLPPLEYSCSGYEFIPNLSIIDVLMWNAPEKVKQHLEMHR